MSPVGALPIRLIHWNAAEAAKRAAFLTRTVRQERTAWYVDASLPATPDILRDLRKNPPAVLIIDLARLPLHGRDFAMSVRKTAATRSIPLVFVEGDPTKTDRVRAHFPDATFCTWQGVRPAVRAAIASQPAKPAVPATALAGYSSTPLPKKLGIKPGMRVALLDAPEDFEATLGVLPEAATLRTGLRGAPGLVVWFVRKESGLRERVEGITARVGQAHLWIAWRKRLALDRAEAAECPTERSVREAGLAAGFVDFKVCAIDATWSGLLFARRGSAG